MQRVRRCRSYLIMVGMMGMAVWCLQFTGPARGSVSLMSVVDLEARLGGACANQGCIQETCGGGGGCPGTSACDLEGGSCVGWDPSNGEKCGTRNGYHNCSETSLGPCAKIWVGAPVMGNCPVQACSLNNQDCGTQKHSCTNSLCPPEG
jgi:hypothetical protein